MLENDAPTTAPGFDTDGEQVLVTSDEQREAVLQGLTVLLTKADRWQLEQVAQFVNNFGTRNHWVQESVLDADEEIAVQALRDFVTTAAVKSEADDAATTTVGDTDTDSDTTDTE